MKQKTHSFKAASKRTCLQHGCLESFEQGDTTRARLRGVESDDWTNVQILFST